MQSRRECVRIRGRVAIAMGCSPPWQPRRLARFQVSSSPACRRTASRTRAADPICESPMVGRYSPLAAADSPPVMPENSYVSKNWVARGGIEPPTRGFSVRRRARPGAGKPKKGKDLLDGRPNRPPRPSAYRTVTPRTRSARHSAHAGQQLARV